MAVVLVPLVKEVVTPVAILMELLTDLVVAEATTEVVLVVTGMVLCHQVVVLVTLVA